MPSILMVKPRWAEEIGFMHPSTPPLGLLHLAAFARRERPEKYDFYIEDETRRRPSEREWLEILGRVKPDLIAISAISVEARRCAELVRIFKCWNPDIPVVIGGAYPTGAGPAALKYTGADAVVRGEGELAFLDILDHLERNRSLDGLIVPGVLLRTATGRSGDGYATVIEDLDDLPLPAYDLLDLEYYFNSYRATTLDSGTRYLPLATSRGCPYGCIYCHNRTSAGYRARTADKVVHDLETLASKYDVHEFEIMDDAFNLDRKRVLDICAGIKSKGIKIRFSFPNGLRGDILDETVIAELKSVGTYFIGFAIESASQRIQNLIHKRLDFEKIGENIDLAVSMGIFTIGFFMLGFPTETRSEMYETIKYALKSRLHLAFFFNVVPFEGTKLFEMVFGPKQDETYMDGLIYDLQYASRSFTDNVNSFELSMIQSAANALFFLNPRRMLRIYKDYPTNRLELLKNGLGFGLYLLWNKPRALARHMLSKKV